MYRFFYLTTLLLVQVTWFKILISILKIANGPSLSLFKKMSGECKKNICWGLFECWIIIMTRISRLFTHTTCSNTIQGKQVYRKQWNEMNLSCTVKYGQSTFCSWIHVMMKYSFFFVMISTKKRIWVITGGYLMLDIEWKTNTVVHKPLLDKHLGIFLVKNKDPFNSESAENVLQ